ncbi:probable ATP-dependent RNA helicase spindle-E [Rhincodon typus]|uniref:probable ATP-dependent RNA helicase spindle-E n=1 Tax=Rhincodon typus TaxID=259920 RepID=UPI00202EC788|nr:probable ATP-dependent RNA helicase spindle-E [Rhincodon typus]
MALKDDLVKSKFLRDVRSCTICLWRCELEEQMTKVEHANSSRDQKDQKNTRWEAFPGAEVDSSLLENDDEYLPGISLLTSRPLLSTLKTISMMEVADYKYPELPITKYREQLIDLIENNSVVVIRGATGSGKSTQLPQYILECYLKKPAFCNIVVTQPRKIGAISIARWICKERRLSIGGLVGYQGTHTWCLSRLRSISHRFARGDSSTSSSSRVRCPAPELETSAAKEARLPPNSSTPVTVFPMVNQSCICCAIKFRIMVHERPPFNTRIRT